MLDNVDKPLKIFITIVLLLLGSSLAHAECAKLTKKQFIERTPIFVKGKVVNLTKQTSKAQRAPLVKFDLNVLLPLKGNITENTLKVEYEDVSSKPGLRTFTEGQVFIFGITEIKNGFAKIYPSVCSPILEDEDFADSLKDSALIKSKSLAVEIAQVYLKSIYGEQVLRQRPFTANRDGRVWHVKGTLPCTSGVPITKVNLCSEIDVIAILSGLKFKV